MAAQKKKKTFKKNTPAKSVPKDEASKNLPEEEISKAEAEKQETQKKDNLPPISLDDELKIEKNLSGEGSSDVPKIDIDEDLEIEKKGQLTNGDSTTDVPFADLYAKLKIEDSQPQDGEIVPVVDPDSPLGIEKLTEIEVKSEPKQVEKPDIKIEAGVDDKKGGSGSEMILVGLLIVLFVIISGIGFFYFKSISLQDSEDTQQTDTTQEVNSNTTGFERSGWYVEILNGSTKAGAAKKLADYLEGKGYKIVKSENAQNNTYKLSEVFVASEMSSNSQYFLDDLKDQIKIPGSTYELKDSTASARIIIGQD